MSTTLRNVCTVDEFINVAETNVASLFQDFDFSFLYNYSVFEPTSRGQEKVFEPPELLQAFLHCYHKEIYGTRPVEREISGGILWKLLGFPRTPSRHVVNKFLNDLGEVIEDVFEKLVEKAKNHGLLDSVYYIDSTDVKTKPYDTYGSWNYDRTKDQYYYGYGCTVVTSGDKIPVAAAFTDSKKTSEETALEVAGKALDIKDPVAVVGDSEFDMIKFHDTLISRGVVPVATYNPRNTSDPLKIDYRVEERVQKTADNVTLKPRDLDKFSQDRSQVERTIGACKPCGMAETQVRTRRNAETQVFLSLCLRVLIAITNKKHGENPGKTKLNT
ncbi:MAG: transposase [Halobacteria archaeon]